MRGKNYRAFGETHGLREWARLLDVNKDTLRYWLVIKGKTVEEFAEKNGLQYSPKIDTGRTRVNRMAQAETLIPQLFDRSDYDPEPLELRPLTGQRVLQVLYNGAPAGLYYLDTGVLKLQNQDEGLNLLEYPVPNPKIYHYPEGWGVHPDTRAKVVDYLIKQSVKTYPQT